MDTLFSIATVIVSVLLIASVLLQARGAATGLTTSDDTGATPTRTPAERFLLIATIVLALLLAALSIAPRFIA